MGVVVHIYKDGAAYEIEFFTLDGGTLDVVTVEADQVRSASRRDVMHVRAMPEGALGLAAEEPHPQPSRGRAAARPYR